MGRRKSKLSKSDSNVLFDRDILGSFVRRVMKDGKKQIAENIVNESFRIASEELNNDVQKIAKEVINKVKPIVEVKSRRVGGSTYPVPVEVRPKRAYMLALKWTIDAANNKKGMCMIKKFSSELINIISGGKSDAMTKRENVHKMAEANKAFEHFGSK
ncbi:30S ribosomal protein S7 [Candidatus Cytomitobacter primus]|uniref:30S ribosomal protein S7 n=1 Tax=Candidatus Cytomitobacter primus TaxID=2066024 RepID=A0A5C0UIP0_9PROT|nr:30S ribosomal protein S7 [Candidatus Cytomitobacter primus]QEK38744.1 30S ribosomal protein S7 [Candidatus Cytomitobacter primus]